MWVPHKVLYVKVAEMGDNHAQAADLTTLSDPYRSMAIAARDLAEWLEDASHPEQAGQARELLAWIIEQGSPPKML